MQKILNTVYRNSLLVVLGATRALGRINFKPPSKWITVFDSVSASSDILYFKLSSMDEDLGNEVMEKEEILEKRLGKQKFYSDEEFRELKERMDEIDVQKPNF